MRSQKQVTIGFMINVIWNDAVQRCDNIYDIVKVVLLYTSEQVKQNILKGEAYIYTPAARVRCLYRPPSQAVSMFG